MPDDLLSKREVIYIDIANDTVPHHVNTLIVVTIIKVNNNKKILIFNIRITKKKKIQQNLCQKKPAAANLNQIGKRQIRQLCVLIN